MITADASPRTDCTCSTEAPPEIRAEAKKCRSPCAVKSTPVDYEIGPESFMVSFNASAAAYANVLIWDDPAFGVLDAGNVWAY